MSSDYTPVNVTSGFGMETTINQNFNEIKTAIDKLLNREISTDNAMEQNFDMGGFVILNSPGLSGTAGSVVLAPGVGLSQTIQTAAVEDTPLILKGFAGQTADVFQVQDSAAVTLFDITSVGNASLAGLLTASTVPTAGGHLTNKTYVDGNNVDIAGDTMTGLLVLSGAPTIGLHAATMGYVDGEISTLDGTTVDIAGDTMTGSLILDIDTNVIALNIDSEATTADAINISVAAMTTGKCIDVPDANSLTSGSMLNLASNSTSTTGRSLFVLTNNNSAATGAILIRLQQDAAGKYFRFANAPEANTTAAISNFTTSGATTHHIQVDINGSKAWIAVSTNNPAV